ncbi:MAG: PSD1 and planctomycete cytochrome C domain-containing protein [Verrucomicrobiota bacterium]
MTSSVNALTGAASIVLLLAPPAQAQSTQNDATNHFESKIRPILVERCYECHSVESGKSKGGLLLDSRQAIREGGDSGPAVVPGNLQDSLLLLAISQEDPDFEMPPKGAPLTKEEISEFETWIKNGAVDPRDRTVADTSTVSLATNHWSYQPLLATPPPSTVAFEAWDSTSIDRYLAARLEQEGLSPSPEADPVTILRRLSFDLVGLPPTPEQIANFSLDRLEDTVDELLASDGFGVRWGRHWLDVVRFAESNGKVANIAYPHAWRYRDYVVDAFNNDLPYDRFLVEQIAGDLLHAEDDDEKVRLLVATGFLAIGSKGLALMDEAQFKADLADEQLDAMGRAFLASSIACARCHDHKSDPVRMEDYYALIGIFKSTDTRFGTWIDIENNQGGRLIHLPRTPGQLIPNRSYSPKEVAEMKAKLAALDEEEEERTMMAEQAKAEGKDMQEDFNDMLANALRIYWSRGPLIGRLDTVDEKGNALPLAMGALEKEEPVDSPMYERGDIGHPGEIVPRSIPPLYNTKTVQEIPKSTSGRRQLAEWITQPDHPLTARVMANRIWAHLMGEGLVTTVDNFGPTGKVPTHPELLDYLSRRFVEEDWSVKSLIREIVLSNAYRQSSEWRKDCFRIDPDNRLLWRKSKRRRDAEELRDSMLAVSGELDSTPLPGSIAADLTSPSIAAVPFNKKVPADLDGSLRRSVYLPVFRDSLPEVLALFDFAEPSLVTGRRDSTNVPSQALYLMNSDFVRARAEGLAQRISDEAADHDERIVRAYELCFNRMPEPGEQELAKSYLSEGIEDPDKQFVNFCQALLGSADFRIAD